MLRPNEIVPVTRACDIRPEITHHADRQINIRRGNDISFQRQLYTLGGIRSAQKQCGNVLGAFNIRKRNPTAFEAVGRYLYRRTVIATGYCNPHLLKRGNQGPDRPL